jgi:hypothetical protein
MWNSLKASLNLISTTKRKLLKLKKKLLNKLNKSIMNNKPKMVENWLLKMGLQPKREVLVEFLLNPLLHNN